MKNNGLKIKFQLSLLLLAAIGCANADANPVPPAERTAVVKVTVDAQSPGDPVPEDFSGLSVETGSVRKNNAGMLGYLFSGENAQTLRIFDQLGIRHLRVGGGSVDMNKVAPTDEEIDELFAFAARSGVKVVYSLRLLNGDLENEVRVAEYVWNRYRDHLDCFAIGNEPDWNSYHRPDPEIRDYPSYLAKWKRFAAAVAAAVPSARFMGPNTGSNYPVSGAKDTNHDGVSWTVNFARDLKNTGLIACLAQHNYVGQDVDASSSPGTMIDKMLSSAWVDREYPALYHATLAPVLEEGLGCRLAESNSFSGQCDGGSNCFATALFALDYMHWWARHGCSGVNFHNKQWVLNAPIGFDGRERLVVNPVGYGIMAFRFGGRGRMLPVAVENACGANVTAYAVAEDKGRICVTLINKEHGYGARDVEIPVAVNAPVVRIETLALTSPDGDPASKGALLGGASVESTSDWQGCWQMHDPGRPTFRLKASSALIVKIITE